MFFHWVDFFLRNVQSLCPFFMYHEGVLLSYLQALFVCKLYSYFFDWLLWCCCLNLLSLRTELFLRRHAKGGCLLLCFLPVAMGRAPEPTLSPHSWCICHIISDLLSESKPFHLSSFSYPIHPPEIAPKTHDQIIPRPINPLLSVIVHPGSREKSWCPSSRCQCRPGTLRSQRCFVWCPPMASFSLAPIPTGHQFSFIFVSQLLWQSLAPWNMWHDSVMRRQPPAETSEQEAPPFFFKGRKKAIELPAALLKKMWQH